MRSILVLILVVGIPVTALAGTYDVENIDGATDPNAFRVSISMTADLDGQCPDYTCAWCCTGHTVRITPAPIDIAPWMIPFGGDPNRFAFDMSEADGTGTYWVDLDVAETTVFSEQQTKATWHPLGFTTCDIEQLCYRIDEAFPELQISGPAVPTAPASWTSLKARF